MKKLINLMRVFALLLMLVGVSSSAWATAYLKGTFNDWGVANAFSNGICKICLNANTTYEFKVNDGNWYGADAEMTSTNCTNWTLYENTGNTKIKTVKSGEYTFKWDSSSKKLSVTYPTTELSCSGSTEDEDCGDNSYLDAIVCDPENTRIIFEEHFNAPSTVTSLDVKSRWEYTASGDGYTAKVPSNYTPMTTSCTAIKDAGSYAVLVNPFYAGCGDQVQGDTYACNCNDSQWYKNITDHTGNRNGGMLFYNCKDGNKNTDMLYECTVDVCANTFINFSAYIASATADNRGCSVTAKVRFLLYDAQTGDELSCYTTQDISLSSGNSWTNIAVMFNSKTAEKVTLKLQNLAKEGCGNDLLLDDITFSVCTPKADLKCSNGNTQISVLAGLTETLTSSLTSGLMNNPYYLWQVRNPLTKVWINLIETPEQNIPTFTVTPDAPNLEYRVIIAPTIEDINNVLNDRNLEIPCGMYAITNNVTVNVELKDLVLTSSIANAYICVDGKNENTLTLKLENPRLVDAKNVIVTLDNIENLNITKRTGLGDYANGVWTVGTLASNATATIELKITSSASVSEQTLKVISAYVSNVDAVSYESYLKAPEGSKKQSNLTLKPVSDTPVLNRPGEHYAYNMCKTENEEEGKKTDPNVIDNKYLFKDYLILEGEDKSGLVWLDMNGNVIPEEKAFFYADEVQDKTVKLYRDLEGSCPSDTIEVRYRVKEITKFTEVGTYKECPIKGDSIPLSNYVKGEKEFKYLFFKDKSNQDVKKFDPSVSGVTTYTVKASYDEINSLGNNYCEADTTITITIKEHATANNISANDATVCPDSLLVLIAEPNFTEEQKNVKLTWYADTTYKRTLAYGETFKYHLIDNAYKVNPDTVYVTVQTDDYCENIPKEAHPVVVTQKEAAPSLKIEPKEQTISVGGVPSFTVSPAGEQKYLLYVNDKKVDKAIEEFKPYIDSQYKLVYEGECGSSYDSARVEVQWPTVFTPYVQDGRNDTFVKDMDPNFYTQIFTRFGTKIYESPNGWDGKVQGAMNGSPDKIAVPGVYYYVVQLPDGNVKKGTIEVFKY